MSGLDSTPLPAGLVPKELVGLMQDGRNTPFWGALQALLREDREAMKEALITCKPEELAVLQAKAENLQHFLELPDIIVANYGQEHEEAEDA